MSVTQTINVEAMTDLHHRLQVPSATATTTTGGVRQPRFRGASPLGAATTLAKSHKGMTPVNATLTRRFSFVWPFVSKENAAATEPFLSSRCSQLLRQFPAFVSGRHDESARTLRDLISRVLTQLKAVWLLLAVYLSLLVLACLSSAVLYTFLLANKPPGLWFLVACIATTGAIAGVSFSARERPRSSRQCAVASAVAVKQQLPQPPKISVN